MRAGRRSAKVLMILGNPENFVTMRLATQSPIFDSRLAHSGSTTGAAAARLFVLLFISLFFCFSVFRLLPKILFRTYPTRLCMLLARPRLIHLLLRPLVGGRINIGRFAAMARR
jgi:CBS domain containing-hemolysin-like protein